MSQMPVHLLNQPQISTVFTPYAPFLHLPPCLDCDLESRKILSLVGPEILIEDEEDGRSVLR